MGMSIDEAITWLNTDDFESKGFADATSVALGIMRKYQTIEEAYKKYQNDLVTNIYADKKFVTALEGIFEDGDNN